MDCRYIKYYSLQSGGGNSDADFGQLLRTQRVFQKGRGIGGFFSGIFRYLKPLLSSALHTLKGEALQIGSDLINTQKPLKEIIRDRSLQVVDNLRDKAAEKIKQMSGSGIRVKKKSIKGQLKRSRKQSKPGSKHDKPKKRKNKNNRKNKNIISNKKRILDIFT